MSKENKQQLFKAAMGNYPTGVTVVTSVDNEGKPVGLAVNSFASVSLDPLMILWSIDHRVSSINTFKNCQRFVVHLLAADQQEVVQVFSTRHMDRFSQVAWQMSKHNVPIIAGAYATMECETVQTVEAGDHTILIGAVTELTAEDKQPLLYHRRQMGAIPASFYEN
ncbi:flavin reductase family protein [Paenibacillus yanchengensis]|uniref:Flavin reductase family protein n=1 Tax=Paenibacillus yanchengensis TaxID=2035833 RepID=A0ABW4YFW0_9BACL